MPIVTRLEGLIAPGEALTKIDSSSVWAEGIVYLPDLNSIRWSDIPGDRIVHHDLTVGITSVYRQGVEFTNGRTLDKDGSMIQCSHGQRRIERDREGVVTPIVSSFDGVAFNSPNDVVVGPDGAIWFTDPPYGIIFPNEGHPGVREYEDHYVFRHDMATGTTRPVITDIEEPNGLAFSPDGTTLYVADSSALTGENGSGNSWIRSYDVHGSRCKNGRLFAQMAVGVPDGLRVDTAGNVWTSAGDGVHVYAPNGEHLGHIAIPETVANLCFGGNSGTELFIAASTSVYSIRTLTTDTNL